MKNIAKAFSRFTVQKDFEKLADIILKTSLLLRSKDNQIPNLEELSEVANRCKKLKGHVGTLISIPSIQEMCNHYNKTEQ